MDLAGKDDRLDVNAFEKFMEELRVLPRVVVKEIKVAEIIKE